MNHFVDPKKPMALVDIGGGNAAVLNVDQASKLFNLLCEAEIVTYDWSASGYKRAKSDRHNEVMLKRFSPEDYAKLALNSTD